MAVGQNLKVLSLFCVILTLFLCCNCGKRKISIHKFDCPKDKDTNITLVYVRATDEVKQNTVQFLWSMYDTPSIIVAYSTKHNYNPDQQPSIDCNKLLSKNPKGAIKWQHDYVSAFEVADIEELHDPHDKVIFQDSDFVKTIKHDIRNVKWKEPKLHKDEVIFEGEYLHGSISIVLNSSSEDGRGSEAPRQIYSNNGTRFTISLTNFNFNTTKTRVAFKLLTHTTQYQGQKSTVLQHRSLDDEHSPGVFRTFALNHTLNETLSSFVSWKPVAYISKDKSLGTQMPSYQYTYRGKPNDYQWFTSNKPQLLLSSKEKCSKIIQAAMEVHESFPTMISFGQKKDGWYKKKKQLIWSGQVGYGQPQFDSISRTLLVTIFVGLGLPVVFILVGSVYVCFKKYRERVTTSTYGKIN